MKITQPMSELRLQRLTRWAMLWLMRVLGWLCAYKTIPAWLQRALDRPLYKVARFVSALVCFRAMRLVPQQAKTRLWRRYVRGGNWRRALRGSALRKLCKRGDVLMRARVLLAALFNIDALVAKQAKRLARGLSRRLGGFVREARVAAAVTHVVPTLCGGDTS